MTLIIPPGYAQFVLSFTSANYDSGRAVVTFGAGEPLGSFPLSFALAAEAVAEQWLSDMDTLTDASVNLEQVECIGPDDSAIQPVNSPGLRGTPSTPPNVALLVKKNTTGRGRRRQGRIFWPSLTQIDDIAEDGTVKPAALSVFQSAVTAFYNGTTAALGCDWAILQNSEGVSPPISPPPVVTSLQVQPKVASQRRRLRS